MCGKSKAEEKVGSGVEGRVDSAGLCRGGRGREDLMSTHISKKDPRKIQERSKKDPRQFQERSKKDPRKIQEISKKDPGKIQERSKKDPRKIQERSKKGPRKIQERSKKDPSAASSHHGRCGGERAILFVHIPISPSRPSRSQYVPVGPSRSQ